jgi:stearoyl-CoA desaturase (delta-9 desaturase)
MVLKRNQEKLASHPNAEQLLQKLQQEYDALIIRFNDFYDAKKQLLASKKQQLIEDVERSDLVKQYKELKQRFVEQQQSWQFFIEKHA